VGAVRAEGEVVSDGEGGRGGVGVVVAGREVARLAGLLAVEGDDEQVLPFVLDVLVPVAVEEFRKTFAFTGFLETSSLFCLFSLSISLNGLSENSG